MDSLLDNVFIDIAIAFALTYALLSLLVMRVQESWHGNLRAGRVHNLHRMLEEALMGDRGLVEQLLDNPLLGALYTAKAARPGHWWGLSAEGPSEIPPELFTRALLMELSATGRPPREDGFTPASFVDELEKAAPAQSSRSRLARALRGLLQGHEGDWSGFETAICGWYSAIGERARGWWKRRSSMVGFWIAVLVCALLNVDAGRIASAFGEDADLRRSFVRLAEGVQDVREQDARAAAAATAASVPAAPGTVAVVVDPATRAVSRMVDAIARLRTAFDRDKAIRAYGFYASDFALCGLDVEAQLLPKRASEPAGGSEQEGRYLSNADTWQTVLPMMLSRIETAVRGEAIERLAASASAPKARGDDGGPIEPARALRDAQRCVTEISAWVRAASGVGSQAESQRLMREAAVALEDTKSALQTLVRTAEAGLNARQLFSADPQAYDDCARTTPTSLAALQRCVRARQNPVNRLPIGLTVANRHAQFCRAVEVCDAQPAAAASAASLGCSQPPADSASWTGWLCTGQARSIPQLGVPAFRMQYGGATGLLAWAAGILVSAFFVSLGAPFWFDLLSKVMRVRASAAARQDDDAALRGEGSQPLPAPAPSPSAAAPSPAAGPPGRNRPLPLVVGADNEFEDQLTVREVQALQQALGVPATGELDSATRAAILSQSRERGLGETSLLTNATYTALVGRPASQARQPAAGLPSGRLRRGEANPMVPLLVKHLQTRMAAFGQKVDPAATTLDAELRALCVLWRYKTDATTPVRNRKVFTMAREQPAQLDEVDQGLLQQIASPGATPLAREAQPWMDWALGELGQVEAKGASRATSNPRVCEYLDAIGSSLGDKGDTTAWCGAFVTWVLKRHAAEGAGRALTLPGTPEGARNWISWPSAAAQRAGAPQPGDVVVVNMPNGKHHVGFALDCDAPTGLVWLLGGNQNDGTCVCLSRFALADVAWAAPPF